MRTVLGSTLCLLMLAAACSRDTGGVRLVQAKIDGITCDKCVPPLTKSLQAHFKSASVVVDDASDTATLKMARAGAFSPADFGQAVTDVKMRVLEVRLEACGRTEAAGSQRILDAGGSRYVLRGQQDVPLNQTVCVGGRLDVSQSPAALDVDTVSAGN
jgi:hypothetical protein